MKYLIVALSFMVLTGCGASDLDKARSEYACKDKGGVYRNGSVWVPIQCNNGETMERPRVIGEETYWVKKNEHKG